MINNGKRALAYITKIDEINPIPNYDRVELATIGGWRVIVSKSDNFKPGDSCVYFEVDSLCPSTDERFAFLEKRKYRVKTLKMCGVISQGLIMPVSAFSEIANKPVDTDVTDILKIKYYEPEDNVRKIGDPNAKYVSMAGRHKKLAKKKWWKWLMRREWGKKLLFTFFGKKKDNPRKFPTHFEHIHKTDEERVENMAWILNNKEPFIVTEKLDGTSTTFILERKKRNKYEFYVLSRNIRQQDENQATYHDHNIYWDMAFKYDVENKLKTYLETHTNTNYVAIQGESVGSVQGNPLKLKEDDFYAFNFITSDKGRFPANLGQEEVNKMGIKWVPILDENYILPDTMEEFKLIADGKSILNPDVIREGIVLRDKNFPTQISFKNVSREYLLKH